jgi:hypothetical protein
MQRDSLIILGVALMAVAIGVGVFLSGRGEVPNTSLSAAANTQQPAVIVPFTPLVSGSQSKVTTRVNYVITSPDQLNKLWKMVDAVGTPPKVDFSKDAVIAVFAGQQSTAGYAISVSKIVDSGARMVSVTIQKPGDTCMVGQVLTAPYEIVAIPTTSLPLAHEDVSTTVSCQN